MSHFRLVAQQHDKNLLHSQLSSPTSSQLSTWRRFCHSMLQPQWETASGDDKEACATTSMGPSWLCHASTLRWILPFLAGKVIWPHNGCELWPSQIDASGAQETLRRRQIPWEQLDVHRSSLICQQLLRHVYSDYFQHCSLAARSSCVVWSVWMWITIWIWILLATRPYDLIWKKSSKLLMASGFAGFTVWVFRPKRCLKFSLGQRDL